VTCEECGVSVPFTQSCAACHCCFDCCQCFEEVFDAEDGFTRDELGIDPEDDYDRFEGSRSG